MSPAPHLPYYCPPAAAPPPTLTKVWQWSTLHGCLASLIPLGHICHTNLVQDLYNTTMTTTVRRKLLPCYAFGVASSCTGVHEQAHAVLLLPCTSCWQRQALQTCWASLCIFIKLECFQSATCMQLTNKIQTLTEGIRMPATAAMAVRPCTSSACWYHLRAVSSLPRFSGSKPKSPASLHKQQQQQH